MKQILIFTTALILIEIIKKIYNFRKVKATYKVGYTYRAAYIAYV